MSNEDSENNKKLLIFNGLQFLFEIRKPLELEPFAII